MQYVQKIDGKIDDTFIYNIYITDKIYEMELTEMLRFAVSVDVSSLNYIDGYLFLYTTFETKSTFGKNRLIIRDVVTEIYHTKIDSFHKFVVFDDLYGLCKLIDNSEEMEYHGENTRLITIIDSPDWIASEIHKKLMGINKTELSNEWETE